MPLQRRLPKVGFTSPKNIFSTELKYDRLATIKEDKIDMELLKKYKLIKKNIKKVKIIGPCTIKVKKSFKDISCTKLVEDYSKSTNNVKKK